MKGEVINTFRDKFHYNTIYEVGAIVDFDKERMENLIARNLCKKVSGKKEEKPEPLKNDKVEKKEVLADPEPEEKEETKKEVLAEPKEEVEDEPKDEELDEKAKSEQEAAEKIAKAKAKANKK